MRKTIFCLSMATAILLGGARTAQATFLAPGSSVAPAIVADTPAGTVVATQKLAIAGGAVTGFINEAVIKDTATGHFDFLYQVQVTGNASGAPLTVANFTRYTGVTFGGVPGVDVTQSKTTTNAAFNSTFVVGTTALGSIVSAQLTASRTQLTASGFSVDTGNNTYILIVKTDVDSFDALGRASTDASFNPTGSYEPLATPEPTSMLLLAGTGLGFGLMTWRKRRRAALAS